MATKKKKSTKKLSFRKTSPLKMLLAVVVVFAVAGIGTYLLTRSNAATVGPHMYMAASNNTTDATFTQFDYGIFGDKYVAGDWDGNGSDTLGVRRGNNFILTNSNTPNPTMAGFQYGEVSDIAIAGNWDGKGGSTVGVFRPSDGKFYLRNTNSAGDADEITAKLGTVLNDQVPLACDWNGDGIIDLGLFRLPTAEWQIFSRYGAAGWVQTVPTFVYGNPHDKPVCGDWDSNKTATPGVYRDSNSTFYLKNTNDGAAGYPQRFGQPGFLPLVGRWTGTAQTLIGAYSVGSAAPTPCEVTGMDVKGTENLKRLQLCINSLIKDGGAPLTPDGILGPLTKAACIKYMGALCPVYVRDYVVPAPKVSAETSTATSTPSIKDPIVAPTNSGLSVKEQCFIIAERIYSVILNAETLRDSFFDPAWPDRSFSTWQNGDDTGSRIMWNYIIDKLKVKYNTDCGTITKDTNITLVKESNEVRMSLVKEWNVIIKNLETRYNP